MDIFKLIDKKNIKKIKEITKNEILEKRNKNRDTPLLYAISLKYEDIAEILILNGANVNVENVEEETPLTLSCKNRMTKFALLLLEKGADPFYEILGGQTSLILAASKGLSEVVEKLCDLRVKVGKKDRWGRTALYYACKKNYPKVVSILLEKGADPNEIIERKQTYLEMSIQERHNEIIEILLNFGANPNLFIFSHPLSMVINTNMVKNIRLLIDAGADPNIMIENRPIFHDVYAFETFKIIADKITDINAVDENGETFLLKLCKREESNSQLEFVKFLLERGADPNILNLFNQACIYVACSKFNLPLISLLLETPITVNILFEDGRSCLSGLLSSFNFYKIKKESLRSTLLKIIEKLVKKGASLNLADSNGSTPLSNLCSFYHDIELINFLISQGAIINPTSIELLRVPDSPKAEVVTLFANYGIDLTINNYIQETVRRLVFDGQGEELQILIDSDLVDPEDPLIEEYLYRIARLTNQNIIDYLFSCLNDVSYVYRTIPLFRETPDLVREAYRFFRQETTRLRTTLISSNEKIRIIKEAKKVKSNAITLIILTASLNK